MKLSLIAVLILILILILILVAACGSQVPLPAPLPPSDELPPPNQVVPPTDEDARACAHLTALGCSDAPICMKAIQSARTDGASVPSACLIGAADLAAVRKCGDSGTLTFECR